MTPVATTVTCPYCRATDRRRDLLMRCAPACGRAEPFRVAELRRGRCPHGRAPQARRSCSACGRDLPREYVDGASRSIAVIGPKGAGKSTWVAAVIRAFGHGEVLQRFPGMSVALLGDSSRAHYHREFEPLLAGGNPAGTGDEPLLLSLRPRVSPVLLAVYDTARGDCSGSLAPRLAAASGILLVLDPAGSPQLGPLVGEPTGMVPVTDLRAALRSDLRLPTRIPLAVILSKVDKIWEMLDERAPTRLPSAHVGHYAESDGLDVHEEVCAWLDRWYAPELVRAVAANFPVHRYFGLSALGGGPCPAAHRVEDPMLWLLARFGAIRTWRGRR